jgi:hypothetical protein
MKYLSKIRATGALLVLLSPLASATSISLVLERNSPSASGLDLFVQSYATRADLLTHTNGSGSFSALPLNPEFSVGGAFYDGAYNLLLERNAASASGLDLFVQSYATLSDLLTHTNGSGSFSALPLNPEFSVGGVFFTPDPGEPPAAVASPSSSMLILAGIGLVIGFRRRKAVLVY